MAKTFSEISVRISANMAELTKSLNKASGDLRKFNGDINKIAGAIGLGFGTQQIAQFTAEILQLSGKAEGVSIAFNKLPNSVGLLNDLRNATKGTISDFELMQRTVQAFNLGIGLKEFPKLLEFATVRAQQTGEEIDYIVQSLVEGIGRKSVLKLDNLGISAERLRNKLGGVSMEAATIGQVTKAFGDIADEELKNMGSLAQTAATKIDSMKSAWTDFKIALGKTVSPAVEPVVSETTKLLKILSESDLSKVEKFGLALFGWMDIIPGMSEISLRYAQMLSKQLEDVALANSGAAAATLYFEEAIKLGKNASQSAIVSLENLNLVISDYNKEIQKANRDKNYQYADKLKNNLKLITDAWTSTNTQLRKDANANTIKRQSDADAVSLENLIQKLKDYDRILRTFKVGDAREAIQLVADVTTGQVFKKVVTKSSQYEKTDKNVQDRLFGSLLGTQGIPNGIEDIVSKANAGIASMQKLRDVIVETNTAFSDAATQGLANFLVGLGDVAAGTVSIGDNILRALSGFLKQFGSALISLGLGSQAFQNLMKNITNPVTAAAAIAVGTALVVAGGALSRSMNQKIRNPGTGWGGSGSSMAGNSGFPTGFNAGNQNITITGRLVGSGRDLVAVIDNTYFDNSMRKGG